MSKKISSSSEQKKILKVNNNNKKRSKNLKKNVDIDNNIIINVTINIAEEKQILRILNDLDSW